MLLPGPSPNLLGTGRGHFSLARVLQFFGGHPGNEIPRLCRGLHGLPKDNNSSQQELRGHGTGDLRSLLLPLRSSSEEPQPGEHRFSLIQRGVHQPGSSNPQVLYVPERKPQGGRVPRQITANTGTALGRTRWQLRPTEGPIPTILWEAADTCRTTYFPGGLPIV